MLDTLEKVLPPDPYFNIDEEEKNVDLRKRYMNAGQQLELMLKAYRGGLVSIDNERFRGYNLDHAPLRFLSHIQNYFWFRNDFSALVELLTNDIQLFNSKFKYFESVVQIDIYFYMISLFIKKIKDNKYRIFRNRKYRKLAWRCYHLLEKEVQPMSSTVPPCLTDEDLLSLWYWPTKEDKELLARYEKDGSI